MENSAGPMTDRPSSRLENHSRNLSSALNSYERASMQYENMLNRLRGPQPESSAAENKGGAVQNEPPIIHQLEELGARLQEVSNKLNNQADELQEYL